MTTEIRSEEDLDRLLRSLGSDEHEVARTLTAAGVKGHREQADCCPVANWLLKETDAPRVLVDANSVTLCPSEFEHVTVIPPLAVNRFVGAFDHHEFPELDERPLRRAVPRDDD